MRLNKNKLMIPLLIGAISISVTSFAADIEESDTSSGYYEDPYLEWYYGDEPDDPETYGSDESGYTADPDLYWTDGTEQYEDPGLYWIDESSQYEDPEFYWTDGTGRYDDPYVDTQGETETREFGTDGMGSSGEAGNSEELPDLFDTDVQAGHNGIFTADIEELDNALITVTLIDPEELPADATMLVELVPDEEAEAMADESLSINEELLSSVGFTITFLNAYGETVVPASGMYVDISV